MSHWQYTPFTLPLLLAAAVSVLLAFYIWRRRHTPGAMSLGLFMVATAVWSLGYALELSITSLPERLFWAKVQYLGIVLVPLTVLTFTLQYTGREKWLTPRNLMLLAIEPLVVLLLVWTNEMHGLMWSYVGLVPFGPFLATEFAFETGFWIHVGYSYLLLFLGTVLLIVMLARSPRLYRKQSAAVTLAVLVPWVGNTIYLLNLDLFHPVDLTPFAFALTGIALVWALFRYQLLDIVPVAREAVFNAMNEGAIVLDMQDRVVDLNSAAERILNYPAHKVIGQAIAQIMPAQVPLLERHSKVTEACEEVKLSDGTTQRDYHLALSSLLDHRGRCTGRLLVLHDITDRKQSEERLRAYSAKLEQSNRDLQEFVQTASHDLQEPLRKIRVFSDRVRCEYADILDERGRDYLERMESAAVRMQDLIEDQLILSRIDPGSPLRVGEPYRGSERDPL